MSCSSMFIGSNLSFDEQRAVISLDEKTPFYSLSILKTISCLASVSSSSQLSKLIVIMLVKLLFISLSSSESNFIFLFFLTVFSFLYGVSGATSTFDFLLGLSSFCSYNILFISKISLSSFLLSTFVARFYSFTEAIKINAISF